MMRGGIRVSIGGTILAMAVFCAQPCLAAIELLAPTNGATVAIVPEAQKKVMSLPTLEERIKLFAEDRAHGKVIRHDKYWRKSLPFVLKWRTTSDKECSCKVEIGKSPDLSDARVWYVKMKKVDAASGREMGGNVFTGGVKSFTVPLAPFVAVFVVECPPPHMACTLADPPIQPSAPLDSPPICTVSPK